MEISPPILEIRGVVWEEVKTGGSPVLKKERGDTGEIDSHPPPVWEEGGFMVQNESMSVWNIHGDYHPFRPESVANAGVATSPSLTIMTIVQS